MIFVLGLIVGSFVNVVAYRFPRGEGFVLGRSHCLHCKRALHWYELVPLVSYLFLRGRCRICRQMISWRYPLVELVSGFIWLLAPGWLAIVLAELFLILALIDFDHLIIPDSLLICFLVLLPFVPTVRWSSLWCAIGLAGFFFLLWHFSKGRWIGFGDVKLMGVLGLVFGFPGSLLIVYGAILMGGALGAILLVTRRATLKTQVPFGTFLAGAAIIFTIYAEQIINFIRVYIG